MVESLKALVVVFTLSLGAFVYARIAFSDIIPGATIDRWRNVYLAATVAAFVIPNFWLVLFALALIAVFMGASEKNKPALYLLLLFAMPAADEIVPGFGGIRNFLNLYPFNILAIVILLPMLFLPNQTVAQRRIGAWADYFFIAFSILSIILAFRETSITDGFRRSTAYILTAFGPYLVFSRFNWTAERIKAATLAYVIPCMALAGVAVAETVLHWHVYASAADNWQIGFFYRYVERSGFLRAYGSVFGPISFGLFLAIAVALTLAPLATARNKALSAIAFLAVSVGLITTFSRGPWIGAAFAVVAFAMVSSEPFKNLLRLGLFGLAGAFLLLLTPFGGELINMLPFIGNVEENTIDYRQRLFEVGWQVAMEHPLFGSEDYLETEAMQTLIQGQGIIDIVNAYLRITLETGLVGLALFVGVSAFSLLAALRSIGAARRMDAELAVYAQAWFAALVGVMLTLATTTSIVAQVAEAHWVLAGMCVGVARSVAAATAAAAAAPPPPGDEPPSDDAPPPGRSSPAPSFAGTLPPHLRQYVRR